MSIKSRTDMEAKELIKLAYDMGAHPYSVGGMVAALQKGIEIGKAEQKVIAKKVFCDTCMGQCADKTHCDTLQRFVNAMED